MDIDGPFPVEPQWPTSLLSAARNLNPFSPLDQNFERPLFDSTSDSRSQEPLVSHPRDVREIPIEFKDGNEPSHHSGSIPIIEEVTDAAPNSAPAPAPALVSEIHGTVTNVDDDDILTAPNSQVARQHLEGDYPLGTHDEHSRQSVPGFNNLPEYANDIEEEMVQAAIEASKRDVEEVYSNQQFGIDNVCQ